MLHGFHPLDNLIFTITQGVMCSSSYYYCGCYYYPYSTDEVIGSEQLNNWPKGTLLLSGRAGIPATSLVRDPKLRSTVHICISSHLDVSNEWWSQGWLGVLGPRQPFLNSQLHLLGLENIKKNQPGEVQAPSSRSQVVSRLWAHLLF